MNAAFRKGEAITKLENYAEIIVLHLTLLVCYPQAQEGQHWKAELEAFKGILKRYNNSKTKRDNFKKEDIVEALCNVIETNEAKDYVANDMMGARKGYAVDYNEIDWSRVEAAIDAFAKEIVQ